MGTIVSRIQSISDEYSLYVFVLGDIYLNGGEMENFRSNFFRLAERFGPRAVIVAGINPIEFSTQVFERYLGDYWNFDAFLRQCPLLMISDAHPDNLSEDSLRLIAPLYHIRDHLGGVDRFFENLIGFVNGRNDGFIQCFENRLNLLDIIDLNPNFCGIGLNLNRFIERFQRR